jgi:hypothetical protein
LQEVIRFHPVFAFGQLVSFFLLVHFLITQNPGLAHCAGEDFEVRGFKIKKGTIIEANIWFV